MGRALAFIVIGIVLGGCAATPEAGNRWAVVPVASESSASNRYTTVLVDGKTGDTWLSSDRGDWRPMSRANGDVPDETNKLTQLTAAHQDAFVTTLSPIDAADEAAKAIEQRFGLPVRYDSGSRISGDYFLAETGAIAQTGKLSIRCEWLKDGETRVTLLSDLPADQYKVIADEVRRALTAASTQESPTESR